MKHFSEKFQHCFLLGLAVILWLVFFRRFYPGEIVLEGDSMSYFENIKYYVENLMRGDYPMWNPFMVWGRPDDFAMRLMGEFNPFYLLILVFHALGLKFSLAYFFYIIVYSLTGAAGFYLLARRIFGEFIPAYLCMIFLLFSSWPVTFLNDNAVMMLSVPMIWFFYFLSAFLQTPRRTFFFGITFSLMTVMITYIPFYFMTVFLTTAILFAILYLSSLKVLTGRLTGFMANNKLFSGACLAALGLSVLPGFLWYIAGSEGSDYFVAWRHTGAASGHAAGVSLAAINAGGLIGFLDFRALFSSLKEIRTGGFFVPLAVFSVFGLGLFLKISRRAILFLGAGTFLILVALTDITPVHGWLYRHVFFFQYFRNLQYLLWFALPFFILLAGELFRGLLECRPAGSWQKTLWIFWAVIVHAGLGLILYFHRPVMPSNIATIVCSFLLSVLFILRPSVSRGIVFILLLFLTVIFQPGEMFSFLRRNSVDQTIVYENTPFQKEFRYVRPEYTPINSMNLTGYSREVPNFRETSGFIDRQVGGYKYIGLRSPFQLFQTVSREALEPYTKYKFVLYDAVERADSDESALEIFKRNLEEKNPRAVVTVSGESSDVLSKNRIEPESPVYVRDENDRVAVKAFSVNRVRLEAAFKEPKFLVYNDSFEKDWNATLDGKATKIFKSNVAFKGVWLPAGHHTVVFRYRSAWYYTLMIFLVFLFLLGLVGLVWRGGVFLSGGEP